MSRIAPWHQTNWDWRAAGNFIGGGTGAGLIIATALVLPDGPALLALGLVGLASIGAGLGCVWLEIGRPWRALNVFLHPQTSWMTREAIISLPLFPLALLALWLQNAPLFWLVALLAIAYLYCQTRILHASKGIPAWRQPALMPLIFVTGLTEGIGLLLVVLPIFQVPPVWTELALLLLLGGRAAAWFRYRKRLARDGAPKGALDAIGEADRTFVWGGHVLPGLLLVLAALAGMDQSGLIQAAGAIAVLGGWFIKFTVVTRAAYNQGFALPRMPVRGVGQTGAGTKPGWHQDN